MQTLRVVIDDCLPVHDKRVKVAIVGGGKPRMLMFSSGITPIQLVAGLVEYTVAVPGGRQIVARIKGVRVADQFTVAQFAASMSANVEFMLRKHFRHHIGNYNDPMLWRTTLASVDQLGDGVDTHGRGEEKVFSCWVIFVYEADATTTHEA